jgi:hypothetical protein
MSQENLLEIPIGFSLAMSCVMGNRMVLNVREINHDSEAAKLLSGTGRPPDDEPSFFSPSGVLTQWELFELHRIQTDQDDYA